MRKSAQPALPGGKKPKKSEATRQHLLELSLKLFATKGFEQTTMRDLARAANLSLGAFYYHFPGKEAVVQEFYEQSFGSFVFHCHRAYAETSRFEERFARALHARIDTFESQRELLVVLSRAAVDPRSELSPFGEGTREIREATIALFAEMIEGSDLRFDKRLAPHLPTLLWMALMGVMLYWVFDESPGQRKTRDLIRIAGPQVARLLRFTRLPLSGTVLKPLLELLRLTMPRP